MAEHLEAGLFFNRKRRRDRFERLGFGTALADAKLPGPDAAIANPLSGTDEQEPATLVARIESFGGTPSGEIINTGDATDRLILAGDGAGGVSLVVRVAGLDEITSGLVKPDTNLASGIHVYVVACDPTIGRFKVYVDGRLVIDVLDAGATKWASIAATWDYAGALTNVGKIEPLEVHLDSLPAIF
ncbi:MAG: hypothetical protein V3T08_09740 [Gemmatimonadota bacterium]